MVADPFEDALAAYGRGDYATALLLIRPLADQGVAIAQSNLGLMYYEGHGLPQNYAEAAKWYRLAAEQGDATAQSDIGLMYRRGQGVPQDYAVATKWFLLAAEQGHAGAQSNLGLMYDDGQGVPQDYAEAIKWFRLAAERGLASAQSNLGFMYYEGHGVPQDHSEAAKWYRCAAEQGDATAQYNLGKMYNKAEGVPQDYAEAAKWYRLAAERGLAFAKNNLAIKYAEGQGVTQDYVTAHMWFNLSAAQGHQDAAKSRDILAQHMTPAQITEAQKLAREWKPTRQPPNANAPNGHGVSDAQFFGDFLVGQQFMNIRFNIPEERFGEFVAGVPDDLRDLAKSWSMFYLLWLMRMSFKRKRGNEFEAAMMQAAYGRLMGATQQLGLSSISVPFAEAMRQWFDLFDECVDATFALKPVGENDFPAAEWKVAMGLLVRDSNSPFYFDPAGRTKEEISRAAAEMTSHLNWG